MDKYKTGQLIAQKRKQKQMSQLDLANALHVTSKAVSKWERGTNFPSIDILIPLAKQLDMTVMDILVGEVVATQNIAKKAEEVSIQVLQQEKKTHFKLLISISCMIVLLFSIVVLYYAPSLLQRGNPLPYWEVSKELSKQNSFVPIENEEGIYLTKIGESTDFIAFVEKQWHLPFLEQAGSAYLFSDGKENFAIVTESLWRSYTVWEIPEMLLHKKRETI